MADLEMVERRIDKATKAAKGDKKSLAGGGAASRACRPSWRRASPPAAIPCDEEEQEILATVDLLTLQAGDLRRQPERGRTLPTAIDANPYYQAGGGSWPHAEGSPGASPSAPRWRRTSPSMDRGGQGAVPGGPGRGAVRSGPAHQGQLHPAGPDLLPHLPARTSAAPGPSPGAPRRPRPPARSTPTSSGASSGPRWSPMTT